MTRPKISKIELQKSRSQRKIGRRIVQYLVASMVAEGEIKTHGKTDSQLRASAIRKIESILASNAEFDVVIDHRESLLSMARRYARQKKYDMSCLFYTMWAEHSINALLISAGKRKGIQPIDVEQVIRRTAMRDKCTWVLRIFGLRAIPQSHLKKLLQVEEHRNAFTHYKWKPIPENTGTKSASPIKGISSTVKFILDYEDKHLFGGRKLSLKKLL